MFVMIVVIVFWDVNNLVFGIKMKVRLVVWIFFKYVKFRSKKIRILWLCYINMFVLYKLLWNIMECVVGIKKYWKKY